MDSIAFPSIHTIRFLFGGLDREKMPWWRNATYTSIETGRSGNSSMHIEQAWRLCIRNGSAHDFILNKPL